MSAVGLLFAAPAGVDTCVSQALSIYPGDAGPTHLRVGEVRVNINACRAADPSQWVTIGSVTTNANAEATGSFVVGASVDPIRSGNFGGILVGTYRINIDSRNCVPFADWICSGSGTAMGQQLRRDHNATGQVRDGGQVRSVNNW
jgi:hypothetical protein